MKNRRPPISLRQVADRLKQPAVSAAEWSGLVAVLAAVLLCPWGLHLSAIPLAVFILICCTAPFFPRLGFYVPIICRGPSEVQAVALTFDDGPDPLSTPQVLRVLRKHGVKATFFVTGKNAASFPDLMRQILQDGHAVGNHSYTHDNLVMFRTSRTIQGEIEAAQSVLKDFGIESLAFRPPVGITGPRLGTALRKTGKYIINYSCRAFDGGNRWIRRLSAKILECAGPGDIILLHDIRPPQASLLNYWLNEVELILTGLQAKGLVVLPLAELIGRPVMRRLDRSAELSK